MTTCELCGHALPGPFLPHALLLDRGAVWCVPCLLGASRILRAAIRQPMCLRGNVAAPLRDNGMGGVADLLLGLAPFEVRG